MICYQTFTIEFGAVKFSINFNRSKLKHESNNIVTIYLFVVKTLSKVIDISTGCNGENFFFALVVLII